MKSQDSMLKTKKNLASRFSVGRLYLYMIHNPVNILYTGLFIVVFLFSYQNTFSKKKQLQSNFSGKIEFEGEEVDEGSGRVLGLQAQPMLYRGHGRRMDHS